MTASEVHPASSSAAVPVTSLLVESVRDRGFGDLPPEVVRLARQCLLDWLGVTLAGYNEPLTRILREEELDQGGNAQATLVGSGERLSLPQAALVNGTASHALDYDDVHLVMSGHPTVPVAPAALALSEHLHASGRQYIEGFVAGFETECRAGSVVMPGHYAVGWHATATLGTLGAAAASAQLLRLSAAQWQHALGIAATQASGFKSMFGTMCKPFHAGRAAANGLLAARLASRGFSSNPDVIETPQGFAATQTTTYRPDSALKWSRTDFAIRDVLFKYHAACFGTHATIEASLRLRDRGIAPQDVESILLRVPEANLAMCNIQEPTTALEGKFSLRFTAALALATGSATEQAFTDERARDPELVQLRDRVTVQGDPGVPGGATEVSIRTRTGQSVREEVNVNVPERDLDLQQSRLEAKFMSLAAPVLGEAGAAKLAARVNTLEDCADMSELLRLTIASPAR